MTRKLKALGLALVALFAISAVGASGASAHSFMSEGNQSNVTLHGTQETAYIFYPAAGSPPEECESASFHGTLAVSPVATVTLHPTYTGCTVDVPVGCNYEFHGTTPEVNMAAVSLNCGMGEPIKVTINGCTIEIGDTHPAGTARNQSLNGVSYTNIGSGTTKEVTVNMIITNMFDVASGGLCVFSGISTGTHTDGIVNFKTKLTGTVASTHVGVTIE